MAKSSPTSETVRFIIEILSARKTPVSEVASTIENIYKGIQSISAKDLAPSKLVQPTHAKTKGQPRVIAVSALGRPRKTPVVIQHPTGLDLSGSPDEDGENDVVFAKPTPRILPPAAAYGATPPRKRGRPRKIVPAPFQDFDDEETVPEPEAVLDPTPQPLSLRRASRVQAEPSLDAQVSAFTPHRASDAPIRGVVKWYDGRVGKGALRLTGISGDVPFDGEILSRCAINRLYKDQEIEAVVEESGGRVKLIAMSLPARNADGFTSGPNGEALGSLRRSRTPVTVEIKQTSVKQRAARAEAEHVLGGVGRIKITRRLIP